MNLLLNNHGRNKKIHWKGGEKEMVLKRLLVLFIIGCFVLMPVSAYAILGDDDDVLPPGDDDDVLPPDPLTTVVEETIHTSTTYNIYGVAIASTQTTTITTTSGTGGDESVTVSETVVQSSWHGGSLKSDTIKRTNTSNDADGSTSDSTYTDTYVYNATGALLSVSGSGSESSVDGTSGTTTTGTIDRTFAVQDGQALLLSSTTTGEMKEDTGAYLGHYTNTTTIALGDYVKKAGSWVPTKQTSNSFSQYESVAGAADGNMTDMTRVTTYTRNAVGTITGMSQTATGDRIVVKGDDPGGDGLATGVYAVENYVATYGFSTEEGWGLTNEDYDWQIQ